MTYPHAEPKAFSVATKADRNRLRFQLQQAYGTADRPNIKDYSVLKLRFRTAGFDNTARQKLVSWLNSRVLAEDAERTSGPLIAVDPHVDYLVCVVGLPVELSLADLQTRAQVVGELAVLANMYHKNPQEVVGSAYYQMRGCPCTIVSKDELWSVAGKDVFHGGGGILEWAASKEDAENLKKRMEMSCRFSGLVVRSWAEDEAEMASRYQATT